jgi:uncharacterized cupredoxin-like copper-binding protein
MSKLRVAMLGLAAVVVLAWAVPAFAKESKANATVITVTAGKPSIFGYVFSKKTAKKGVVVFNIKNAGTLPHDLKINGKKSAMLQPGKSAKLTVTFAKAGTFKYECTVPGHAAGGMKGTFKIT